MPLKYKKLKIGKKFIEAFLVNLQNKNFILLKGSRGYIMCGYLNLKAAQKFKDTAAKITGVSSIEDALKVNVHSCTAAAKKIGIYPGQPMKEALKLIS